MDPERTRKEPGTAAFAHQNLTRSLLPGLMQEVFKVESVKRFINHGSNKVRFINVVRVNSDICSQAVLARAVSGESMLRIEFEITAELKGSDKPVAVFEAVEQLNKKGVRHE